MTVTHTPPDVSVASEAEPSFVSYTVTVRNVGSSALTQTSVTACLVAGAEPAEGCAPPPPGAAFDSASPSSGSCAVDDARASCQLGSLASGAVATVELVARAPDEPGDFLNLVTTTVNEGPNDTPGPDPNEDTVTVSDLVSALPPGPTASSFVPSGTSLALFVTDRGQSGQARIPSEHEDLTAQLAVTDEPPFTCPKGEVCRGGAWIDAVIPGTFEPGLRFVLRWPAALVPAKQSVRNFVLFYLACDACELEIIRARCTTGTPSLSEMPCLWNVRDLRKNGFEATLISPHNGKMH